MVVVVERDGDGVVCYFGVESKIISVYTFGLLQKLIKDNPLPTSHVGSRLFCSVMVIMRMIIFVLCSLQGNWRSSRDPRLTR